MMKSLMKSGSNIQWDEILKSLPASIIGAMTPNTIVGWVGAFILTLLIIIVGSFIAIIIILGTVCYNRWDIIIATLFVLFLVRMYRGSGQKKTDHKD